MSIRCAWRSSRRSTRSRSTYSPQSFASWDSSWCLSSATPSASLTGHVLVLPGLPCPKVFLLSLIRFFTASIIISAVNGVGHICFASWNVLFAIFISIHFHPKRSCCGYIDACKGRVSNETVMNFRQDAPNAFHTSAPTLQQTSIGTSLSSSPSNHCKSGSLVRIIGFSSYNCIPPISSSLIRFIRHSWDSPHVFFY